MLNSTQWHCGMQTLQGTSDFPLQETKPMAQPIPLEAPPRDLRREQAQRLEAARLDHAEALLEGYELIEQLHQSRTLELLRGAVGARGQLSETLAAAADMPQGVNALRNLALLAKMLGSIDPQVMESYVGAVVGAAGSVRAGEADPPGLLAVLKQLRRREVRRALEFINRFLELLGTGLAEKRAAEKKS
jgi:uncharacterized protein YjgD (DUF1641 family)